MRAGRLAAMLAALALVFLGGCATQRAVPELPKELGSKGLLIARLYILGMQAMEDASINIDGKLISSSMKDGYIAVPLEPGDHTLSQIRAAGQLLTDARVADSPYRLAKRGGGPSFIYIPGGSYTVHYTTLSVDRTFRIEPGKVTNLGLIVYVPVQDDPNVKRAAVNGGRSFTVVALDNSAEASSFLDANYPDLVKTLSDRRILLAPFKYLEPKRLPDLRRAIAFHESRGPRVVGSPTRTVIYGRAGTVVSVSKPPQDQKPSIDVLDTGTLADIVGAARRGEQYTFLTSDAQLLSWDGIKLDRTPLPYRIQPVRLHSLGETGMVVIDNRLRVLTTKRQGDQWNNFEGFMTSTPRSDIRVVGDQEGVYISLGQRGLPESIHYLKAGETQPKPLVRPAHKEGVTGTSYHYLVARESGLFIMFDKPDFYFWSKEGQRWRINTQPPGKCKPMRFDDAGANLAIECDSVEFRSSDSGANWKRQEI